MKTSVKVLKTHNWIEKTFLSRINNNMTKLYYVVIIQQTDTKSGCLPLTLTLDLIESVLSVGYPIRIDSNAHIFGRFLSLQLKVV